MSQITAEQRRIDLEAKHAITASQGYPKEPGQCAGFVRTVMRNVLGVDRAWKPGPDAKQVAALLAQRGYEIKKSDGSTIGDIFVWDGPGHGFHGHTAIRVSGNQIAENSSLHSHNGSDARGFRPLAYLDGNYRVFRLWK